MTSQIRRPDLKNLQPRIIVFGVGGAGGNAINNMIQSGLEGAEFVAANTDAQALSLSKAGHIIQLGTDVTQGLGAGAMPETGKSAAEESKSEIEELLDGYHMVFIAAGMGGGTGTGAAPVIARLAKEKGLLTVGVVTKPFAFEGKRRMKVAEEGVKELSEVVDTLIVIPNQNLFRVSTQATTFSEAFKMADDVLYSGISSITDLMVKEGLINLDFSDIRTVMCSMGKAMMGTGEAEGEDRALRAAEAAIANPLLDEASMSGASGLLLSISGGNDLTLYEVDKAAERIRQEVDEDANIIVGAIKDDALEGKVRISVVATGLKNDGQNGTKAPFTNHGINKIISENPKKSQIDKDIKNKTTAALENLNFDSKSKQNYEPKAELLVEPQPNFKAVADLAMLNSREHQENTLSTVKNEMLAQHKEPAINKIYSQSMPIFESKLRSHEPKIKFDQDFSKQKVELVEQLKQHQNASTSSLQEFSPLVSDKRVDVLNKQPAPQTHTFIKKLKEFFSPKEQASTNNKWQVNDEKIASFAPRALNPVAKNMQQLNSVYPSQEIFEEETIELPSFLQRQVK